MEDELHTVFKANTGRQICIIAASVISILLGILSAFYIYQFRWLALKHTPFIAKRHPKLVQIGCCYLMIVLFIERPLSAFSRIDGYSSIELQWVWWSIHVVSSQGWLLCAVTRIFITWLDVSFNKARAKNSWVKYIDEFSECKHESFIVEHHKSLGNLTKLAPLLMTANVLTIATILTLSYIEPALGYSVNTVCVAFQFVVTLTFWCKTPQFMDLFHIRGTDMCCL